jgi:hypothetical protein
MTETEPLEPEDEDQDEPESEPETGTEETGPEQEPSG